MSDTPPEEDFAGLYRRAFAKYGTRALWNKRRLERPAAKPGSWQSGLRKRVVALSKIQTDILRLLAAHRDPES
jgi:hypothetical protein